MSFASIPAELRDRVCDYLPENDQLALAATSSAFLPIAQRRLFRHLALSPSAKNLAVVPVLAANPHLARCVRSFAVSVPGDAPVLRSFYHQLAIALALMSELTSLDISVDPAASWLLSASQPNPLPRLARFSSTFHYDHHLARFLHRTPALSELEFDDHPLDPHRSPVPAPLPPHIIPALAEFTGPSHIAARLVPGRPLQSISITSGDLNTHTLQAFASATTDPIMLSISTTAQPIPVLQAIAQHLPRLLYLRIITTYTFPEAPDSAFHEAVANALNSLTALATFDLSGMHWGSFTKPQEGDKRVWQSQPLTADSTQADVLIDDDADALDFDDFFAY